MHNLSSHPLPKEAADLSNPELPGEIQDDRDWYIGAKARAFAKGKKDVVSAEAVVRVKAKITFGALLKLVPFFLRLLGRKNGEHQD